MSDTETTDAEDTAPLSGEVETGYDPDELSPWTIKAIPKGVRDMAMMAARKEGVTVGKWVAKVIPGAARDAVSGAADVSPGQPRSAQVPAVIPPPVSPGMPELDAAFRAAEIVKQVTDIQGLPESLRREAFGLLRSRLRDARGLPVSTPRKARPRKGQARAGLPGLPDGQTAQETGQTLPGGTNHTPTEENAQATVEHANPTSEDRSETALAAE